MCCKCSAAAGVTTDHPEQRAARPLDSELGGVGTSPYPPCPKPVVLTLGLDRIKIA